MKNMRVLILALLYAQFSLGCTPGENPADIVNHEFTLITQSLELSCEAQIKTVEITSPSKVNIVGQADWCKTSKTAWKEGQTTLTLDIAENGSLEERSCSFSIICGTEKIVLDIKQAGKIEVPVEENEAFLLSRTLGMGWNLGNQLDAIVNGVSSETCWGNNPCTQKTMDGIKAKGFTTVRIPVTWQGHIGDAPDYRIDQKWLDRVGEIAGYAKNAGLHAIINVHHDGDWLSIVKLSKEDAHAEEIRARYAALWKQVAEHFKDEGEWLIFEAFNELHDGSWGWGTNTSDGGAQYRALNSLAQLFVDTVRSVGGQNSNRYLGIPGYVANPTLAIQNLVLPEDSATNRLLVSVHFYDPSGFALGQNEDHSEWGHTGKSGKKDPNHDEASVLASFKALYEHFIANNIPVYIGESGCVNREGERARAFQKYYLEYVYKAAREYGMAIILWDNGAVGRGHECFGFINHSTGEYINSSKEIIESMRKATFNTDEDYTIESVYNQAP